MHIEPVRRFVTNFPREAIIWMLGLAALAFVDPSRVAHFTLCPISYLGYDFCPGCGLGRSIAWLFHGSLENSLRLHPLGMVALAVLIHRIVQLTQNHFNTIWQK